MKNIKSLFWYNKSQRKGILYLAILIVTIQFLYFFVDFSSDEVADLNTSEIVLFQDKIDSLKRIEIENRKPKIYPFNPSFITDYKGYKLGMSTQELDKLFAFRKQGKYINSSKQFQNVTGVSDSLLGKISPFFKFPDWVTKRAQQTKLKTNFSGQRTNINLATIIDLQQVNGVGEKLSKRIVKFRGSIGGYVNEKQLEKVYGLKPKVVIAILKRFYIEKERITNYVTKDINKATTEDFKRIYGVGNKLSARIIKFRKSIGGFYFEDQLQEVYGLKPEVILELNKHFKILSKPTIIQIDINEATFKQVLHLPYIDYELTKKIFNYRDEFAVFQHIEELKKIEGFPLDKYDRIVLYLKAE